MDNTKSVVGRFIPLTGPDVDRIAVAAAKLLKTDELHATNDHNRLFYNNQVIAPAWHGEVDNEAVMLNLYDNSVRGCFEGDECFRTDRGTVWRCIANNGTESDEWIELSRPQVISKKGDLLYGDASGDEARLGIGPEGYVLKSISGLPAWSKSTPLTTKGDIIVAGTGGAEERFGIGTAKYLLAVNTGGDGYSFVNDRVYKGAATASELTMATDRLLGRYDASTGAIQEVQLGSGVAFSAGKLTVTGFLAAGDDIAGALSMNGTTADGYKDGKLVGRGSDGYGDTEEIKCIPPLHVFESFGGGSIQLQTDDDYFNVVNDGSPTTDGWYLTLKTLPETIGGTGLTAYTKGQILYSDASNSLAALNIGTKGQVLAVSSGGIPEWITAGGTGDVVGPSSSVDSRLALFDSTTGKLLKQSSNLTESGGVLTSGTLIGLAAGGTNQNVTLKPSGTGVILLDVDSPVFENDTSKAGTSFAEFPRFRPKAGQNANGGLVISPRGTGAESYIILAGSENVTTTDIDYMAFGGGFSGAISGSWNFGALKLANATGTGRNISFVISNSGGRTEILRLGSGGLIQFRQDNPILEYNIPGSGSVVQEALIVRPLTSNKNGRLIVTPSLSNTEATVTCFAHGTPNTADTPQCIVGGGTGGIPSGHWGIASTCYANASINGRPFSIVVGNASDGRIETARFLINGGVWLGKQAALSTGATGGFVFVPTCAGTPTGTPASAPSGLAPIIIDTTNHRFYFYSGGAWRNAGP